MQAQRFTRVLTAFLCLSFGSALAGADLVDVDVTGILSMDRLRSSNNVDILVWIGPFNVVNGIGYDVVLQTIAPGSRLSDIAMAVTNSAGFPGPNFGISPAFGEDFPGGPSHYSRPVFDLPDIFDEVTALQDGLIRLSFFDSPDDAPGAADGLWVSGTITLQTLHPIPDIVSPGVSAPFCLGALAIFRRRRHRS